MVPRCVTLLKHARLLHESYNENDDTVTKLERAFSVFTFDMDKENFCVLRKIFLPDTSWIEVFLPRAKTDYPVFVLSRTHLMTFIQAELGSLSDSLDGFLEVITSLLCKLAKIKNYDAMTGTEEIVNEEIVLYQPVKLASRLQFYPLYLLVNSEVILLVASLQAVSMDRSWSWVAWICLTLCRLHLLYLLFIRNV